MARTWIVDGDDERLPDLWSGFVDLNEEVLVLLLEVARDQCIAFAPTLPDGAEIPAGWVVAQARQARELARSGVFAGDQMGQMGHEGPTFPLDWHVKQLLRPKRGKPNPK